MASAFAVLERISNNPPVSQATFWRNFRLSIVVSYRSFFYCSKVIAPSIALTVEVAVSATFFCNLALVHLPVEVLYVPSNWAKFTAVGNANLPVLDPCAKYG